MHTLLDPVLALLSSIYIWPLVLAIPIGFLIGLVGVGGVLVVPLLANVAGYGERAAIGMSLASFVCLGVVALLSRIRTGKLPSLKEWLLYATMVPGAAAGAFALDYIPDLYLSICIAISVVTTGTWTVFYRSPPRESQTALGFRRSAVYGTITGSASALTGTGGPLVLMPLLMSQGVAVKEALGLSKAAQLPVALTATVVRGFGGGIDFGVAGTLSVLLIAGMLIGTRTAGLLPANGLRRAVGWALTAVGVALCVADVRKVVS